jgi:hypothetical protein
MMTHAERGRKGGLETVRRHGREHMARIGALGFAGLAAYARGGRKAALGRLVARGRIPAPRPGGFVGGGNSLGSAKGTH